MEILLKVGACGLLVVSTFDACALLGIRLYRTSGGNHKAVSVERFFRFLNQASSGRDTSNLMWVEASMIDTYF